MSTKYFFHVISTMRIRLSASDFLCEILIHRKSLKIASSKEEDADVPFSQFYPICEEARKETLENILRLDHRFWFTFVIIEVEFYVHTIDIALIDFYSTFPLPKIPTTSINGSNFSYIVTCVVFRCFSMFYVSAFCISFIAIGVGFICTSRQYASHVWFYIVEVFLVCCWCW